MLCCSTICSPELWIRFCYFGLGQRRWKLSRLSPSLVTPLPLLVQSCDFDLQCVQFTPLPGVHLKLEISLLRNDSVLACKGKTLLLQTALQNEPYSEMCVSKFLQTLMFFLFLQGFYEYLICCDLLPFLAGMVQLKLT